MKSIKLTLVLGALLLNNSCKIAHSSTFANDYIDRMGQKLYNCIEYYYLANLGYPQTVDKLIEFLWNDTKKLNNDKFSSFEEYLNSNEKLETGSEDVLYFLTNNQSDIRIKNKDNKLFVFYKKRVMELNLDYCKDKNNLFGGLARMGIFTYDDSGNLTREDYQEEFSQLCKSVREKHYKDYLDEQARDTTIRLLLRYGKRNGLYTVCPEEIDIINNSFLKEISFALDTFTNKKDIDMIQFLFSIRK